MECGLPSPSACRWSVAGLDGGVDMERRRGSRGGKIRIEEKKKERRRNRGRRREENRRRWW